ncbi:MAG: hypothetical protein AAF318_03185 [Pseudomonadota bacterium]
MDFSSLMRAQGLTFISVTPVEIRNAIWLCVGFEEASKPLGDNPHLAFIFAERDWLSEADLRVALARAFHGRDGVLSRIHSECILGDAFGSSMCDCGTQMRLAMDEMERRREGVFVYLRQEGRGIGMRNKLDVLALQYGYKHGEKGDTRYSSDDANVAMGFDVDERNYRSAAGLFQALGVKSLELITGNPEKIADIEEAGVKIASTLDLWTNGVSARAMNEIREKIARGYTYQR